MKESVEIEDINVNAPSIHFEMLLKNGVSRVLRTAAYVTIGYLTSMAPPSFAQSENVTRTDTSSSYSDLSLLNDELPVGTDDLERPPKFIEVPGNAGHYDLLQTHVANKSTLFAEQALKIYRLSVSPLVKFTTDWMVSSTYRSRSHTGIVLSGQSLPCLSTGQQNEKKIN